MTIFKFELKKLMVSRWLFVLLLSIFLFSGGYYFWKSFEIRQVIPDKVQVMKRERGYIANIRDSFESLHPDEYEQLDQEFSNELRSPFQLSKNAEEELLKLNSGNYIENRLAFFEKFPLFMELFNSPYSYSSSENEDIYYLQLLKKAAQTYEDKDSSIFPPNLIYQFFRFFSNPLVFIFLLFLCFVPFGREKESGSVLFMFGFSPTQRKYLATNQLLIYLTTIIYLSLLVLSVFLIGYLAKNSLLDGDTFTRDWIVDSSFYYQSVISFNTATLSFATLSVFLVAIYLTIFYLVNIYVSNIILANGLFLAVSILIGNLGSRLQIVGNPFRFHEFQQLLFNEPTGIDLFLTCMVSLFISLGIFFFASNKKNIVRMVK